MKSAPLQYQRAHSIDEATQLLREQAGAGKILAGGQTLLPMLNLRMGMVDTVIDIARIEACRAVHDNPDHVRIGAAVTHAMIEDGLVPDRFAGYLRHVAGGIAYRSVRTRGTIGGSLAHADPAADWPTALLALNAQAEVLRGDGTHETLTLSSFQVGLMETSLEPEDLLIAIHVPTLSSSARWAYRKFCRKVGEFAQSLVAIVHDPEKDHTLCVLGAAADKPVVLPESSDWLSKHSGTDFDAAELQARMAADLARIEGLEPDSYSYQLHRTQLTRAFQDILKP